MPRQGLSSPLIHRQGARLLNLIRGENFLKKGHSGVKTHAKLLAGNSPGPRSAVFTQGRLPCKETKLLYEASDGENAFPEAGKRAPALATGVAVEEFPEHSFS